MTRLSHTVFDPSFDKVALGLLLAAVLGVPASLLARETKSERDTESAPVVATSQAPAAAPRAERPVEAAPRGERPQRVERDLPPSDDSSGPADFERARPNTSRSGSSNEISEGRRHGSHGHRRGHHYYPRDWSYYGRSGYGYGYGWPFYSWGGWSPRHYYPYVLSDYRYERDSALTRNHGAFDLDIVPEKAQVFIDGRYVGVADDFDGFPEFLWLEAGTYDVVFYMPGYRTISRQYSLSGGSLVDVEDNMEPGESVRPEDLVSKSTERRDTRIARDEEQVREVEARERRSDRPDGPGDKNIGRLILSIWPEDAAIYIDGNFAGTGGEVGRLSAGLILPPGEHRIEIVRPGYRTVDRQVVLPPGEEVKIQLDLERF